jgi:hypothetical protein
VAVFHDIVNYSFFRAKNIVVLLAALKSKSVSPEFGFADKPQTLMLLSFSLLASIMNDLNVSIRYRSLQGRTPIISRNVFNDTCL